MDDTEFRRLILDENEKLRRELREEIDVLFKKEKEIIQDRVSLYLSVGKWASLAVAAMLAALGISKADDIERTITNYLKEKIENRYKFDSPDSELLANLDKIVERSTVSSTFIETQAYAIEHDRPENLSYNRSQDLKRLLKVVNDPSTDTVLFSRAVVGLRYLADSDEAAELTVKSLSSILQPNEKIDKDWIYQNEGKIRAIIGFPESELLSKAIVKFIETYHELPEEILRDSSLRFMNEKYAPASDVVAEVARRTYDKDTAFIAIRTLARINPNHPQFQELLRTKIMTETEKQTTRNLFIAFEIVRSRAARQYSNEQTNIQAGLERVTNYAAPITEAILDSDVKITYKPESQELQFSNSYWDTTTIDESILDKTMLTALLDRANNISPKQLLHRVISVLPQNARYTLESELKETSSFKKEDGTIIKADDILDKKIYISIIQPSGPPSNQYIEYSWTENRTNTALKSKGQIISPASFNIQFYRFME